MVQRVYHEFIVSVTHMLVIRNAIRSKSCVSVSPNYFSQLCYFFWIWNLAPLTHHNPSFLSRNACQILQHHWIREEHEEKNESGILLKYIQLVKPVGSRIVYQLLLHSLLNLDQFYSYSELTILIACSPDAIEECGGDSNIITLKREFEDHLVLLASGTAKQDD